MLSEVIIQFSMRYLTMVGFLQSIYFFGNSSQNIDLISNFTGVVAAEMDASKISSQDLTINPAYKSDQSRL